MIRHIYTDRRERAEALGVWSAVSGLGLALGPVIGGVLVGIWSWRAVFWFNVIFGMVALVAAALVLPENSNPVRAPIDLPGFMLGALHTGLCRLRHHSRRVGRVRHLVDHRPVRPSLDGGRLLRARRAAGTQPDVGPVLFPASAVRRQQLRGLYHVLRDVLHLLLRRAVPAGRRLQLALRHRSRLLPDGRRHGYRLDLHRPLGRAIRPARAHDRWLPPHRGGHPRERTR